LRLFTAIDIPDEVIGNLASLLDRLRPSARIKWSPIENMHITTKFIGEWPEDRMAELQSVLGGLSSYPPISIRVAHLGFFPNPHSPRVFWAGIQAAPGLMSLAHETEMALASLGLAPEKRAFSPHLTLARIKEPVPLVKLQKAIAELESAEFGSFTADRFYLYRSRLAPSGSVYTKLSEFVLSK
jgi:2'-5' RNA ligase